MAGVNAKADINEPPPEFQKTAWTDLTIVVEGRELYFNKYPLVMTSPVLKNVLTESDDPTRLVFKDDKYTSVLEFLRCLHPEVSSPITDKNLENVISMAHKYQHRGMLSRCEDFMEKTIRDAAYRYSDLCFHIYVAEKYQLSVVVQEGVSSERAQQIWFTSDVQSNTYFKQLSPNTQKALLCTRLTYLENQLRSSIRNKPRGTDACECLKWVVLDNKTKYK